MEEQQAKQLAELLGGEAWQSGGDIWIVIKKRSDGSLAVISEDAVTEYENEEAMQENRADNFILLV